MSKKKKQQSRARPSTRSIVVAVVLIAIFSGLSFYLGMATPRTFSTPVNLATSMGLTLQYDLTLNYGPAHTGVRVSFEVTSASGSWSVDIRNADGLPLDAISSSDTGTFGTDWLYSPGGCIIQIRMQSSFPTSMNLDGTLAITSSRFPFI